jgi:hypothetical protein
MTDVHYKQHPGMTYTLKRVTAGEFNADLSAFKHSIFLTPQWIDTVSRNDKDALYLDIYDGDELVGKISGLIVRSPFVNKEVYFYSEPALKDYSPSVLSACHKVLANYAKNARFTRITFGFLDQKSGILPDGDGGLTVKPTFEYIIQLQAEYKDFVPGRSFKDKIKKAEKANTEFYISHSPEMVDRLVQMLDETYKTRINKRRSKYNVLNYKNVNPETLKRLVHQGNAVFYCGKNQDAINYISLTLEIENRAYGLYTGTSQFGYANGLPGWMEKKRAEWYQTRGFTYINLGGIPHEKKDKNKLIDFKSQVGCTPFPVYMAQSAFLCYPEKLINVFYNLGRLMPYNRFTRYLIRLLE